MRRVSGNYPEMLQGTHDRWPLGVWAWVKHLSSPFSIGGGGLRQSLVGLDMGDPTRFRNEAVRLPNVFLYLLIARHVHSHFPDRTRLTPTLLA